MELFDFFIAQIHGIGIFRGYLIIGEVNWRNDLAFDPVQDEHAEMMDRLADGVEPETQDRSFFSWK